jgi:hypothetical protein
VGPPVAKVADRAAAKAAGADRVSPSSKRGGRAAAYP